MTKRDFSGFQCLGWVNVVAGLRYQTCTPVALANQQIHPAMLYYNKTVRYKDFTQLKETNLKLIAFRSNVAVENILDKIVYFYHNAHFVIFYA